MNNIRKNIRTNLSLIGAILSSNEVQAQAVSGVVSYGVTRVVGKALLVAVAPMGAIPVAFVTGVTLGTMAYQTYKVFGAGE